MYWTAAPGSSDVAALVDINEAMPTSVGEWRNGRGAHVRDDKS